MSSPAQHTLRPKLWWFINRFHRGGAELGLLKLVENNFFQDFELTICTIVEGDASLREEFEQRGIQTLTMKAQDGLGPKEWIQSVFWLRQKIRAHQPQILVLSLPQANIAGRIAAKLFNKRYRPEVISFEHNTVLAKPIYETLFRLTGRFIDAIFADCQETAAVAQKKFYHRQGILPVWIVPLVSFEPLKETIEKWQPSDPVQLISAGRLTTVKNHLCILRALPLLKEAGVNAELTIYGEGSQRKQLEEEAEKLGVTRQLNLPGFVSNWPQKPADIFILSSTQEGLCIVVLEAMRAGHAVISPNLGGLKDYGDDETVFLLEETTPEAICDKVARAVHDPVQTTQMIQQQQQKIDALYSTPVVQRILQHIAADIRKTFQV